MNVLKLSNTYHDLPEVCLTALKILKILMVKSLLFSPVDVFGMSHHGTCLTSSSCLPSK